MFKYFFILLENAKQCHSNFAKKIIKRTNFSRKVFPRHFLSHKSTTFIFKNMYKLLLSIYFNYINNTSKRKLVKPYE